MHKHHIIPKSRGGTDDDWNLVELDPYTHAYEHALDFVLFEQAPWFDCRHEAWPLLPQDLQDAARKEMARRTTLKQLGKTRSAKVRAAISRGMQGGERSLERRRKISQTLAGNRLSDVCKERISQALKGRPKPLVQCPHCEKVGGASSMSRWHFDNCRVKLT